MAKKGEKKPQDSGKTDPKKSTGTGKKPKKGRETDPKKASDTGKKSKKGGKTDTGKKPSPKKTAGKKKGSQAPKSAPILCQFCEKPMKDEKTKKIHQRSCKEKSREKPTPKQEDVGSALLELKDRFEDEQQQMFKSFREREDNLQRELEEVKTVLRLEMDRHRKEVERIGRVEREMSERKVRPEPEAESTELEPAVEVPPPPEKSEEAVAEPRHAPNRQPRAIDMIPMRIPPIPRKKPEPIGEIPDIDDEEPLPVPKTPGLDREAIEGIVRDILEQTPAGASADTGHMEDKLDRLAERLDRLDTKLEKSTTELGKSLKRVGHDTEMKRFEKEVDKLSEKVQGIMEDSGYGESLSVSKIPPTILEIVYQAILDDIYVEMVRTKGAQDAERIARSALEEVRLKTSGSELFKYDGHKIVTENLAKSIEANHISANQIQTTYNVLTDRLLETVPHHKAKNFKGMIKVKSQEFAVDRATKLTKDFVRVEKAVDSTSQMVAAMSANFNSQNLDIHEKLDRLGENLLATKASVDDVNALRNKQDETNERCMKLVDDFALLKTELEMKSSIKEKDEGVFLAPGEEPSQSDVPDGGVFTAKPPSESLEDTPNAEAIMAAVAGGAGSRTAIIKKSGLTETEVVEGLDWLVSAKKIIEKKSGKRARYSTLELELGKAKEGAGSEGGKPAKKKPEPEADRALSVKYEPGKVTLGDEPEVEPAEPAADEVKQKPGVIVLDDDPVHAEPPPEPVKEPKAGKKEEKPEPKVGKKPKAGKKEEKPEPKAAKKPKAGKKRSKPGAKKDDKKPDTGKGPALLDDIPVVKKTLSQLSEEEKLVLDSVSEDGMALSGIQSKAGKNLKRSELLRALRVLIDSGHVGIVAKGRMELYQRINVTKMDKPKEKKNKKEVK